MKRRISAYQAGSTCASPSSTMQGALRKGIFASLEDGSEEQEGLQVARHDPSSILFVIFTSGSTGAPKGVVISNANAASAMHYQAEHMGITAESRVYEFASYSFDVSISDFLVTLTAGGCLCVPSDQDWRTRLEESIVALNANTLDLTPSVANLLSPASVPGIHTILLSGEALRLRDVQRWWGKSMADGFSLAHVPPEAIGRDFAGWTSMYDGSRIPLEEMDEWLDDTLQTILSGRRPDRVLEIGTGSGAILFNLLGGLLGYVGLEPSQREVDFVEAAVESLPSTADRGKVRVVKAAAHDIAGLGADVGADLVILNSVIQYFPSHGYLFRVVHDILRLPGLIEHVEILPKRMKAFNEPSCFRYAAVVHVKAKDHEQRQIRHVGQDEWIDFVACKLSRREMADMLGHASDSLIAVNNIPQMATVFEQQAASFFSQGDPESRLQDCRLPLLSQALEPGSCLSAADLVELAEQAGCRVEISWARQFSQRGGIDAIFHRLPSTNGSNRTLFRFPTDHRDRPYHSFTSRPLMQHAKKKVKQELHQRLYAQLPSYMVPRTIIVLDEMPVNNSGKLNRRELADRMASGKQGRIPGKQPTTEAERRMQRIWAEVLDMNPAAVGVDDSFFQLDGDSIVAMKAVAKARNSGINITAADIFRKETISALVREPRLDEPGPDQGSAQEVDLIEPDTKRALLEYLDSADMGIHSTEVADILPLTSFQEMIALEATVLRRQSASYFYLDLGTDLDLQLFRMSCRLLVQILPILRALFLSLRGEFWQVILKQLDPTIQIHDIVGNDVDRLSHEFCLQDLENYSPPCQVPLSFTLLRHKDRGTRLILRLCHAQFDGICLRAVFQSLVDGCSKDRDLPPPAPDFSSFLSYALRRRASCVAYWNELLRGSRLSSIRPNLPAPSFVADSEPVPVQVNASLDLACLPDKITAATLVSTAWAVLVSRITAQDDVVYGHVIAGRNAVMEGIDDLVGPSLNFIPVRARLQPTQSLASLLLASQDQFLAMGEADLLSTRDIVKYCTDWPVGSDFESVVHHQNVDAPEIRTPKGVARVIDFDNPHFVFSNIRVISSRGQGKLHVLLSANSHIWTLGTAHALMDSLVWVIRRLVDSADSSVASCMQGIQLML
ncbi:hypothetical protein HIM_08447 [Hirsutella minnesotensis 3608]|uniref:Carrier domain-containing protein n=1 Tax=Hirsutella minnesotensis 3608 TaxID=1043627 RepID=A0A0F7ZYB5_9HYPO|nr:hypothetical protein HIM_08447 [Hirsutella minnesotensis 3608]